MIFGTRLFAGVSSFGMTAVPISTMPWPHSRPTSVTSKYPTRTWYLTGVPDLMAVAGRRFEDFAAHSGQDRHG